MRVDEEPFKDGWFVFLLNNEQSSLENIELEFFNVHSKDSKFLCPPYIIIALDRDLLHYFEEFGSYETKPKLSSQLSKSFLLRFFALLLRWWSRLFIWILI